MRMVISFSIALMNLLLPMPVSGSVIWEDSFSDPNLNTAIWIPQNGGHGWGNGELQFYTNRIDDIEGSNAYIEDGSLVIEARREDYGRNRFTSARLSTKGSLAFTYGTLEARIKLPDLANGLWPAFWLLGANIDSVGWPACGELDIMEMGSAAAIREGAVNRKVTAAAHWESGGNRADYAGGTYTAAPAHTDYHLFKLEWTPSFIQVCLDGVPYWQMDIRGASQADLEEYHRPMFIILNLAVGGWNYVETTDPNEITASFPAKMYIDWIRLTANEWTECLNVKNKTVDEPEDEKKSAPSREKMESRANGGV